MAVGIPGRTRERCPLFLTQLSEKLRSESTGDAHSPDAIGATAARHGRDLLTLGLTVSQVVHDYGDICHAITELAIEQDAPITTDEFRTLNGCLDTAIAEAVTEHARITAAERSHEHVERSGHIAHETRDLLNTAILAYTALKQCELKQIQSHEEREPQKQWVDVDPQQDAGGYEAPAIIRNERSTVMMFSPQDGTSICGAMADCAVGSRCAVM